ncbi:MAG: hypothetical protein CMI54_00640 [Parcubacteria group bacterium]|jgi:hypothetical protein|nr:hypothetical protein [Parcubacteria group bacterium]
MKRFIKMVLNLFGMLATPKEVSWLTLEDRLNSEVRLDSGNAKGRRTQVRQWCIQQGIDKPWCITSLRARDWKKGCKSLGRVI